MGGLLTWVLRKIVYADSMVSSSSSLSRAVRPTEQFMDGHKVAFLGRD
jgi:hypothetical protein